MKRVNQLLSSFIVASLSGTSAQAQSVDSQTPVSVTEATSVPSKPPANEEVIGDDFYTLFVFFLIVDEGVVLGDEVGQRCTF